MRLNPTRRLVSTLCVAATALAAASIAVPWTAAGALAAPVPFNTHPAAAPPLDKVTKKDGTVLEGRITKEVEGWVWFTRVQGAIETEVILNPKEIDKIDRGDPTPSDAKPEDAAEPKGKGGGDDPKARKNPSGVPRAVVLTLEGEVGIQFAAKPLDEAIPLLEEDGINIVVLKINSGGGLLLEIQRLSDVIHDKYKKKFRTVAWIESAISAAAMSSHCLEEIYFLPEGNFGACTGWSGQLVAMKGRGLEQVLLMMEKISARGNHPKEIMRAMQISSDEGDLQNLAILPPGGQLSADINPTTGEVSWYQGLEGQYILNPKGGVRILTFNSEEAKKFKFSRGTAKDIKELAQLMGYQEIEWVGKEKKGVGYPISRAEEYQLKWRKDTTDAEDNLRVYLAEYGRNVQTAQSMSDKGDRGRWIGKARSSLEFLRNIVKKHPNIGLLNNLDKPWFEEQDDMLKKLTR